MVINEMGVKDSDFPLGPIVKGEKNLKSEPWQGFNEPTKSSLDTNIKNESV
jgi:hypothetical protein